MSVVDAAVAAAELVESLFEDLGIVIGCFLAGDESLPEARGNIGATELLNGSEVKLRRPEVSGSSRGSHSSNGVALESGAFEEVFILFVADSSTELRWKCSRANVSEMEEINSK